MMSESGDRMSVSEYDFSILGERGLTPREIETVSYLPLGYTNAQIAQAMSVKEVTIKKHLGSAGEKLSAKGKTEILFRALTIKQNYLLSKQHNSGSYV